MAFDFFADREDKDREWMTQAACEDAPASIFFLEDEPATQRDNVAKAKTICGGCRVRERCLEYALTNNEHYGIWGGQTVLERKRIARVRRETE